MLRTDGKILLCLHRAPDATGPVGDLEAAVIRPFQERMPYGLFVPEADAGAIE
jgi:hypothetical protein